MLFFQGMLKVGLGSEWGQMGWMDNILPGKRMGWMDNIHPSKPPIHPTNGILTIFGVKSFRTSASRRAENWSPRPHHCSGGGDITFWTGNGSRMPETNFFP